MERLKDPMLEQTVPKFAATSSTDQSPPPVDESE
jgi:hypothetical protein